MRQGIQYRLTTPLSQVWQRLGQRSLGEIIDEIASALNIDDQAELHRMLLPVLLSADAAGLLKLYPK
jgi:hypothetical protein